MNISQGLTNFITSDIYGLTAEEFSLGRNNIEVVDEMIAAGIKVIQYREKEKKALYMYRECLEIRERTRQAGVTFIVNDHIDLAIAVKADGVHIGQEDLPPEKVRQLVGPSMLLGLSTHLPEQAQNAVKSGVVDYIGVGPIFATNTKKDVCDPVGLTYLDYVVNNIDLPFVAIGGIKLHNIAEVRKHGAKISALVTEIVGAENIIEKVSAIRKAMYE
ncbi:thiamine-phosphate synthase [Sporomusaceae bacterium FL31]|nr:thiamine-phosphate synthase [Sporomusaceae bacterium FL31]GCE32647.1 thiamine-phosphate synthase [Sporomusaceae bacterium]